MEFMIELGDASIADLLMRRVQMLERLQYFLCRPHNGIMVAALRFDLNEQCHVTEEDERIRELRSFLFAARR